MIKPIPCLIIVTILFSVAAESQTDDSVNYPVVIMDSPAQLFTMRQVNESYVSGYRLLARGLYAVTPDEKLADLIQVGVQSLFLLPLTHEEGHRSILTVNHIGSISQPYFNKDGAAYVNGVTDQTLKTLRDTDLPSFIRLHAAGLESDYMLTRRIETLASFGEDTFDHYKWEYWLRKASILQYYTMALIHYDIDIEEEDDERERDIVGHDIYGAARHLHRPAIDFYRYTRYDDLTKEEKDYVDRLAYRSFLNVLNPLVFGKTHFKLTPSTQINAGLGYTMAPFGDFIDETVWLKHQNLQLKIYARQFQNKENWFPGVGIGLSDFPLLNSLSISIAGHLWQQPEQFDFTTAESFWGGAIDTRVQYFFKSKENLMLDAVSIDVGLLYKTKGFLPEELYLDEHFGIRLGTTIRL